MWSNNTLHLLLWQNPSCITKDRVPGQLPSELTNHIDFFLESMIFFYISGILCFIIFVFYLHTTQKMACTFRAHLVNQLSCLFPFHSKGGSPTLSCKVDKAHYFCFCEIIAKWSDVQPLIHPYFLQVPSVRVFVHYSTHNTSAETLPTHHASSCLGVS